MSLDRYAEKGHIKAAERRRVLNEVNQLAEGIERCERTVSSIMADMKVINTKYEGVRTTRQEVEFLKLLLDCAKRKLAWEKQVSSLKKRAPSLLESMSAIMSDKDHPPTDELKSNMLNALKLVQNALQKLQSIETAE